MGRHAARPLPPARREARRPARAPPQARPPRGPGGGRSSARRRGKRRRSNASSRSCSRRPCSPRSPRPKPSLRAGGRFRHRPGASGTTSGAGPVPDPATERRSRTADPNGPYDVRDGALPADLVLPVPLETPAPRYPDIARIVRKEGAVVLSATIAADGKVVDIEVEKGMGPLLDQAAIDAVSRWRYVPARIGERRVAVILRVTVTFRLL